MPENIGISLFLYTVSNRIIEKVIYLVSSNKQLTMRMAAKDHTLDKDVRMFLKTQIKF